MMSRAYVTYTPAQIVSLLGVRAGRSAGRKAVSCNAALRSVPSASNARLMDVAPLRRRTIALDLFAPTRHVSAIRTAVQGRNVSKVNVWEEALMAIPAPPMRSVKEGPAQAVTARAPALPV